MVHRVHKASVGLVLAGVGLVLAGVGLVLAPACGGAPRLDGEIEAGDTTVIELGDTVFEAGDTVTVPAGEVLEGDLYAAGEAVRFLGQSIGDLVTAGISVLVDGPIDGDVLAVGSNVDLLGGPIGDSARIFGDQVIVNTTIDGDLVVVGVSRLQLAENAVIRGGFLGGASTVEIEGTVEGDLRAGAGELILRGTVLGDANVRADRLDLAPGARIDGDLDYRTRVPLSPEAAARVAGTVRYTERVDDDSVAGSLLFWMWQAGAAMLAGLLAVALFRRLVQRLVSTIAEETTLGALLGFGAFLIAPVGAVVVMITVVGLPIGIIAVLLFGVALYVAKLPVAVWTGEQLLARAGHAHASPYAALAVGILAFYLLFEIPWLGWLFWLAATWLGLGAMILFGRRYLSAEAE